MHDKRPLMYSQRNRARPRNMELNDDIIVEIISYLPLKLAVQCKVLSKYFNYRISDLKFHQILFLRHQMNTLIIYQSHTKKISINPIIPSSHRVTTLRLGVSVVASCKGLLLLDFHKALTFCLFNPITGSHQLVPYPQSYKHGGLGYAGLAVDYPTSDQYTLVTIEKLAEDEKQGYIFQVFSSGGVWRESQSRMKPRSTTFCYQFQRKTAYVNGSVHWLRRDNRVVAFDIKKEEATILDLPDLIKNHMSNRRTNMTLHRFSIQLGMVQGLLTVICSVNKSTIIATYDYESNNWRVSPTLENFITTSLPICIDGKHTLYLVGRGYLYKYDFEMNSYEIAAQLSDEDLRFLYGAYSLNPMLASFHETALSRTVDAQHLPVITAALDALRKSITRGVGK